ncbi:MAG: hypothetical protein K0Q72_3122 [Armatimonadetes bacterium]|jgi:Uma2 family endonuclease|nr:hypothetical protein [Armatimonadota bacterium]
MTDTLARPGTMTAEEFYDFCAGKDARLELVRGEVVEMSPASVRHGMLDTRLSLSIGAFVLAHQLGEYVLNTGFILFREPDEVRGPDQAYVSNERMAACPPPERGFWAVVPDLVVEIVSPGDTAEELNQKVREYLAAGVRLIWVFYPKTQEVLVHRPSASVEVLQRSGTLRGDEVLTGFELPLEQVWNR